MPAAAAGERGLRQSAIYSRHRYTLLLLLKCVLYVRYKIIQLVDIYMYYIIFQSIGSSPIDSKASLHRENIL